MWLAFRGKDRDVVCAELGLHRTGERVDIPQPHVVAAELPDGWFVVVVSGDISLLNETGSNPPTLESLSVGCELVSCSMDTYVMCSGATAWRHGKQQWSVVRDEPTSTGDYDGIRAEGRLPQQFWEISEKWRYEHYTADDRDEVDYVFGIPEDLAESVTGFRYHGRIGKPGPEYYEVLDWPATADLMTLTSDAIGYALAAQGFRPAGTSSGPWGTEYVASAGGSALLTSAVRVFIERSECGGVGVAGYASIVSRAARDVMLTLPRQARMEFDDDEYVRREQIDSVGFGNFDRSQDFPGWFSEREIVTDGGAGAEWVMGYVTGPAVRWHAERDTVAKIAALARIENEGGYVEPRRLRGAVVLCVLDGATEAAAELMVWYLSREQFYSQESRERAQAFDLALRDRFPDYAHAREQGVT